MWMMTLTTLASGTVAAAQQPTARQAMAEPSPAAGREPGTASREPKTERRAPSAGQQPTTFWAALGDTTLQRLVAEALRTGHDVQAAEARVRGARAARTTAALDLAPAVTVAGGYTRQRLASPAIPGAVGEIPDQELWDAGLRLSWEVDVFGRVRRSVQGRGALVDAAREDVRDTRVLIAAEVAAAYFELRGAQDRLAVAERNAENQRRTLELTLQRLEAGRGTELDSERARAQLSTTRSVIPTLRAAIEDAENRIAVLAGRDPGALDPMLAPGAPPPPLPESLAVAASDSVARRRPDVRSAERVAAARSALVGAARADYLPRLALGGAAGYTGTTVESLGETGTPRYVIGPVISWPALDIGRVRAGVEAARADEAEARARYEQTVLRARGEAQTSLVAYNRARERLERLAEAAAASERAAELARLRFEEGASDFLQVLDAERTLLDAQDRLAAGRADATLALVRVYRALGGVWPGR
jgi:NodT family efflux transporter outer membrane factor (OMF) lipoprotein